MRKYEDIRYGDHFENAFINFTLPDADTFPLFIYFHGGGFKGGNRKGAPFAETMAQSGIGVASVEYRLYPDAKYPDFLDDGARAVAWIKANFARFGKAQGLYVGGSSAGGYLSMMLCFDERFLAKYGMHPDELAGYIHDAGQPTAHFNVLRERGLDARRVIIDETAPLYYVGTRDAYPPMLFIVSDDDMKNRYEQTMLTLSTLKHFGYDEKKIRLQVMHGKHCQYISKEGSAAYTDIVSSFIRSFPAEAGLEPAASGLSLRAALRCPKKSSDSR